MLKSRLRSNLTKDDVPVARSEAVSVRKKAIKHLQRKKKVDHLLLSIEGAFSIRNVAKTRVKFIPAL